IQSLQLIANAPTAPITLKVMNGVTLSASSNINVGANATINLLNGSVITSMLHIDAGGQLTGGGTVYGALENDGALNVIGLLTVSDTPDGAGNPSFGQVTGNGKTTVSAGATLIAANLHQSELNIGGTVIFQSSQAGVSRVNILRIAGGNFPSGHLDLTN